MSAIGIDFGTTNSSASWVNPQTQEPEVIVFHETGTTKMPSVAFFPKTGDPIVGLPAYQQLENLDGLDADDRKMILRSTITSIKRRLTRDGLYNLHGKTYSHQDIVSLILAKIKKEAAISCPFNDEINEVVLTHPVVFEEWKKELLKGAATEAGFNTVTLLEEPVSAAIGYARSHQMEDVKGILVYDFGGGTFDVAYVQKEEDGSFRIPLAPKGDNQCGGDDVDMLMYKKWEALAQQNYKRTIAPQAGQQDVSFMFRCRKNKELLSGVEQGNFSELLPVIPPNGQMQRLQMGMNRQEFNDLVSPIVDKTIRKTSELLDDIKEAHLPLDVVLLIGGSSRLPMVEERLQQVLGKVPIKKTGQVDVAVALGALSQATIVEKRVRTCFCIFDGTPMKTTWKFCPKCGKDNYMYNK